MKRLRTLDRYVALTLARTYLLALVALLAVFTIFAFVEELEDLGKGRYRLADAALFTLLTTPRRVIDLAPVTALLANLTALGALASGRELVAMQAAGVSPLRIGWSALRPGLLFVAIAVALGQFVAPPLDRVAHVKRAQALSATVAIQSEHGFWSWAGHRFLRVRDIRAGGVLGGVEIYEFDGDGRLRRFMHAHRADVQAGAAWRLTDVVQKDFEAGGVVWRRLPVLTWESFLNTEQVALLALPPSILSFSDLYQYVRYLRASGQDSATYELALWQKASMPLAVGAMTLLSVPFVLGVMRMATTGQRMMIGSLLGVGFHLASQITARLGLLLNLSPAVTAFAPALVVLAVTVWWFRRIG
ncbi:MAG TPA: LPS export ABC transporter permease LptG [Methylomirabilota bacterium]|nr:LPS export ABC transporter permease LptG [Methylomirabilota bacterium]